MAKPRSLEREPVRQAIPDATEREPVRAKVRTRKGVGQDRFHIPADLIPDGIDLQWNVDSVLGQPSVQERARMEAQGWEAVTPEMFDGRFDGMFMRKGHKGEINDGGQVLMWRPLELTLEARAEELAAARSARYIEDRKMSTGSVDGVDPNFMNASNPHAQKLTFLKKSRIPSMPISD